MSKDFEKRLRAVERRINARPGKGTFTIVLIEGCLPGPIRYAYSGALSWKRPDEEELLAFTERCAREAREAGETSLVVGGLPRDGELHAEFATFEDWWATVAPYYPEVPEPERHGYAPPRRTGLFASATAEPQPAPVAAPPAADDGLPDWRKAPPPGA